MVTTKKKKKKKTTTTTTAASGGGNTRMEWLVGFMKANPKAVYADAAAAATRAGHQIYPIMWGKAQALLGRVKQKPRGQGKAALAKKAAVAQAAGTTTGAGPAPVKRGPGRPRKAESAPAAPVKRGPGRPRKVEAAAPAPSAPVKRGPGRPKKVAPATAAKTATPARAARNGQISIAVGEADLGTMQRLVDAVNGRGKASLRYSGGGWELAVD